MVDCIIAGAERCGTTSLYNTLIKHSAIGAAYTKEIEFFDRYYDNGFEWYHEQFSNPGLKIEATPTYFWNPKVPDRIKKYNPKIKIIILYPHHIGNRVKSKYLQQVKKGVEHLSYDDALTFEDIRIRGEYDRLKLLPYNYWPELYCEYAYSDRYDYRHVLRWQKTFGKNLLLVRDLFETQDIKPITDFLGIPYEPIPLEHLNSNVCAE